jgi:hypothetical protein
MFSDKRYRWRETYFVLFTANKRPQLKKVQQALAALNPRYQLTNLSGDEQGRFESLTLIAPDDYVALDICYVEGEEVQEHMADLLKDLKRGDPGKSQAEMLQRLSACDARLDVLHFEQVTDRDQEDDEDEVLDPGTLLLTLGALARLTGGIAVDPQSGTIFEE